MIPVFNRAHLIGQTIESIQRQKFQDFKLVVVDDASTDNTVEVVREYCLHDARLEIYTNAKNLGLTRNWNLCLQLAKAPLVQIMQSDDLIDPDYLGLVSEFFDQHPNVGFVAASCRYIGPNSEAIDPGVARQPRLYRAGDQAVMALIKGGFPHVSSIVMRRECYEKFGKFDERIWHGPDMEMGARMAKYYDFYHFGAVYSSFRRHGSNMGVLEYLRKDFLEVDMYKRRLTWGYLSPAALNELGIDNLDRFAKKQSAESALVGAIGMMAYERADLSRYYIRRALKLDPEISRSARFWKSIALNLVPFLGVKVMKKRLRISKSDSANAKATHNSLMSLP